MAIGLAIGGLNFAINISPCALTGAAVSHGMHKASKVAR